MSQKVFIIGGTGYIGYHICNELVQKGYLVTALSFDNVPAGFLPPQVEVIKANIDDLSDSDLEKYFAGHDYFMFAAGADDRTIVKGSAYDFFHKANVASVERLLTIAKTQQVKKVVILNSYFAYFNRLWPEMHLAETHPYIRSRKQQQEMAFQICDKTMPVAVLELPYIVGVTPTKGSLWSGLIRYVNNGSKYKFYTAGGTAVTSVRNVGLAAANALELTTENTIYQVADQNLSWADWLKSLRADKAKQIKVITIPNFLVKIGAICLNIIYKLRGEQPGLNIVSFIDLQTKNTFLPIAECQAKLQYAKYDVAEDFEQTIRLCL